MKLGSFFDGLGGWQIAAVHAGVTPIWSSEIEKFACALTKHHFPNTLQVGDITKLNGEELPPVDIITAGSPCQDLSVAGKQEGLKGARSGLFLQAIKLVRDMRRRTNGKYPRFFVWENVPGAFSSNGGMDFLAVLEEIGEAKLPIPQNGKWANAGMVELPICEIAWRVLDAQYWGVPQRRKRIFLVADFAESGRCAAKILFEREGVRGDNSTGGATWEGTPAGTENRLGNTIVRLRAGKPGGGKGALISKEKSLSLKSDNDQVLFIPDKARSLTARADGSPCVDRGPDVIATYTVSSYAEYVKSDICGSLKAKGGDTGSGGEGLVSLQKAVRRLTPIECERLQGLPDNYTLIDDKSCSDSARYKALGNGMAQPCADWIIKRIAEVVL